jgi:cyclophilin family peptidyl-prolyl cis-trans isomerase
VGENVTSFSVTPPLISPALTYQFYVTPHISNRSIGNSPGLTATFNGMTSKPGVSGAPGSPFSHAFAQLSGSTVSSRTLVETPSNPSGLTFNATNGTLSGFYPPKGNYTLFYTVNFATGCSLSQTFHIRSRPSAGAPLVGTPLPAWSAAVGATRDTPLAGAFLDPEAESAYRVNTTAGNMDFILFDTSTPDTVTNFKNYVEAGKYNDVAFHRCFPGGTLQSGTIKGIGTGSNFTRVVADTPTPNEPGISNTLGTLAMTKVSATDPDSATSEFFINVANNSTAFDSSNGGTTVFGRVASPSLSVVNAIAALQRGTYNLTIDGSSTTTPYPDFPLTGTAALPANIDQTRLVKINSITPLPTLNYSITGNTSPTVASAAIVNQTLRLTALARGTTNITVTATDLDGLTNNQVISVNLLDTFSSWATLQTFPRGESGANQDPDADGWDNLNEFAFLGNPASPNATSQVVFPGVTGTTASHLTLTFPVRKLTQRLSYQVEANNRLAEGWTTVWRSSDGFGHPQVVSAVDQADRTVLTIKDTATIGPNPQRFLRTRVTQD